jgi:hypothetical protein
MIIKNMEEVMKTIGPGTINQIVFEVNNKGISKSDIVDIVQVPKGFILIYFD